MIDSKERAGKEEAPGEPQEGDGLNRFAWLLDRLAYEPRRNGKLALIANYLRTTPDPDRGYALAAMTGGLSFRNAKAGLIRALIAERTDPVLFALSYDYVGDLSETVALMWPAKHGANAVPHLPEVVEALREAGKTDLPRLVASWLDALDETGRWALLKLITGSLRIGVSARLAKTAAASLGGIPADEVEHVWHGLEPPYVELFAWLEGRGPRPEATDPAPFRPVMLSHPLEDGDFDKLDPAEFSAEWKWDGIRVQAASGLREDGSRVTRMYSRTGEDIAGAFPDLIEELTQDGAVDGELLVMRESTVQSFNTLQQRLNRKAVTARMLGEFPAHIRVYDLLVDGQEDIRHLPFAERRQRLEAFLSRLASPRFDLSPIIPFASWEALTAARADPASAGAGADADAVEGCMIKRLDSPYLPGRPKGYWWKWKRDARLVDCVLMYAQRGHGKRSSFYSDYTFGVWRVGEEGGLELVPVGKAYFGFTDEELIELDKYVRKHTLNRFGPVREVTHTAQSGLVFEVAFEGLQRSTRHKSGVAMRFPRINRIRWDKPPSEADHIEVLEAMLPRDAS
ncbi:cisplatin damage response ATP-dependent DNA ligase [Bosea sp. (in: a-proteobacteria)]|uniref:cisplatin damage response ATP-dependent DNA ligase n=1 Tax=Bosea sp. (in: a-proteobacteria) TaxID=1871050 RepID=UPI0011F9E224|nr:cisplatin damage response ATP-dependent DNA ligase [Bosea sp. (in: a-proteobacteria)]TAJ27722.1 MAG: cisplatin damage response ATP-dependent DNA ligase [Bosea sp. (in: a-proteobacteria)]